MLYCSAGKEWVRYSEEDIWELSLSEEDLEERRRKRAAKEGGSDGKGGSSSSSSSSGPPATRGAIADTSSRLEQADDEHNESANKLIIGCTATPFRRGPDKLNLVSWFECGPDKLNLVRVGLNAT